MTHAEPLDPSYRWKVLGVVMVGTVMSALDASIVNVALPNIMASFGANVDQIEWVVTGYMLGFSTFMPLTAWLRERVGYRTLYMGSLAVFTLGSVLCGLAPNLTTLVIARVIQAFGGGAVTPTGMALIAEVFPPQERGRALGYWGVGVILGPAIGPTLGGYLTEIFGWRSIFNINLPVGMIALFASARVLQREDSANRQGRPFDLPGFLLLSSFLVTALLALSNGNHEGWTSHYVITCGVISVISFALFMAVESVVAEGILDLGLFKNTQFSVALVVTGARSIALYGGTFLLPLFLQSYMGRSEVEAGLLLLPGALVIGAMMPIAARIAERTGPRLPTLLGLVLTALFMWMYRRLDVTTSTWDVLFPTLIRGVGLGLLITPVMTAAMNAVPTQKAGMASSMLSLTQQVAGSLGIAVLASVLGHRATFHRAVVGQSLHADSPALLQATHGVALRALELGVPPDAARAVGQSVVGKHAVLAAGVLSFNDAFLVGAAVVLVGIIPAVLLKDAARVSTAGTSEAHALE
ncbi:MAG: DHA2 family efflux MFS transporter permease subunit [Polyangiaceae bacterium]